MKALVIDDSAPIRKLLRETLKQSCEEIEARGVANTQIASKLVRSEFFDLIILINRVAWNELGEFIALLKEVHLDSKCVIIHARQIEPNLHLPSTIEIVEVPQELSPLTYDHALGALLPIVKRRFNARSKSVDEIPSILKVPKQQSLKPAGPNKENPDSADFSPSVLLIASSTGGPAALDDFFGPFIGKKLKIPILIAQHMPPVFTAHLAGRLASMTGLDIREARHGDEIQPGKVLIAPGDFHMRVAMAQPSRFVVTLDQGRKLMESVLLLIFYLNRQLPRLGSQCSPLF